MADQQAAAEALGAALAAIEKAADALGVELIDPKVETMSDVVRRQAADASSANPGRAA
jgi:hypothetical protein